MKRPIKLFAYKLGRELHMDVDIIMAWSLSKLKEYMAFYMSEDSEWQEEYKQSQMTPEEKAQAMKAFFNTIK